MGYQMVAEPLKEEETWIKKRIQIEVMTDKSSRLPFALLLSCISPLTPS